MAKKKANPHRTDAERRLRQSQRLARVMRALRCIAGPGRWDAEALAQELECSVRTIHRILAVLTEAGVPFKFDPITRAYRLPPGYKFAGADLEASKDPSPTNPKAVSAAAKRLLDEGERFLNALKDFCETLD